MVQQGQCRREAVPAPAAWRLGMRAGRTVVWGSDMGWSGHWGHQPTDSQDSSRKICPQIHVRKGMRLHHPAVGPALPPMAAWWARATAPLCRWETENQEARVPPGQLHLSPPLPPTSSVELPFAESLFKVWLWHGKN